MKLNSRKAALALILAMPPALAAAAGGRICGRVSIEGKALPSGFVSLLPDARAWAGSAAAGTTELSLVRFRDGRFCLEDVSAGNYSLRISPFGQADPMPVRYPELPLDSQAYRLSVGKNGPEVYDAEGRLRKRGDLDLVFIPAPEGGARFEGELVFAAGEPPPARPQEALIMIKLEKPLEAAVYAFGWVEAPLVDGRTRVLVKAPAGLVDSIEVALPGWGISAVVPKLRDENEGTRLEIRSSATVRATVFMGAAGTIAGTATLPSGVPFRPSHRAGRFASVALERVKEDFVVRQYLAHDGSYEMTAAAGLRIINVKGMGDGFDWLGGPLRLLWTHAGAQQEVPTAFLDWAEILVKEKKAPGLGWKSKTGHFYSKERIVGLASDDRSAGRFSQFLIADESLATLYRTEAGYWEPWGKTMASDASTAYRIPSAAYDFYWIEFMEHPYTNAAVRVLGASGGVTLAPRTVSDLTFARRYERGTAGIKGTIRGMKVPGTDELRKAGSVAGIHVLIAPRINIYDVRGDYRGTAFVRVAGEEFTGLVDALERGDDAAVKAAFRPREYAIQGFPPGRYRVQIVAYGSPLREREVLLTEGRTLRLDIDFDRF